MAITKAERDKILELSEEYRVSSLTYQSTETEWAREDVSEAYQQLKNYLTAMVYRR